MLSITKWEAARFTYLFSSTLVYSVVQEGVAVVVEVVVVMVMKTRVLVLGVTAATTTVMASLIHLFVSEDQS